MSDKNPSSGRRWAMTGAAGSVGRHLRKALHGVFDDLLLLDIVDIDDLAPHERMQRNDLRDFDSTRQAVEGLDGVIHLGGLADEADFHDLAEVNIVGTYHLLEAARMGGVPRVVYASSNRATGFYPTSHVVSPDEPFRPDGLYGVTKAATEAMGRLYSDKFGLEVACLRIGSFETEPSTPRELHTWLSPDDCAAAFRAAVEGDYSFTTYYAVSNNSEAWWDLSAGNEIGFVPQDDAASFTAQIEGELSEPQGGRFASPEFTLSRQRHTPEAASQG
jgi:uronate dehydrogenase